jgi:hypothetical protein
MAISGRALTKENQGAGRVHVSSAGSAKVRSVRAQARRFQYFTLGNEWLQLRQLRTWWVEQLTWCCGVDYDYYYYYSGRERREENLRRRSTSYPPDLHLKKFG